MDEYQMLPVDISVLRNYRIYVKVKNGAGFADVHAAVLKYIATNGLDDADLDLELPEIEESDVRGFFPDWDGAFASDEGGIE